MCKAASDTKRCEDPLQTEQTDTTLQCFICHFKKCQDMKRDEWDVKTFGKL